MPTEFVPDRAHHLRLITGLSRESLGRRAGISRESVRLIESGKVSPRPETVKAIAEALGVETSELYAEAVPA